MRSEIANALTYFRTLKARPIPSELQQPPDPSIDYSQFINEEDKRNLDTVQMNCTCLIDSLRLAEDITNVHFGTTTTLNVSWDKNENNHIVNHIVIELTLYGPLAAVFAYGPVPEGILQHVYNCIDNCGLIRLTENEVKTLEEHDEYLNLFE